MHSTCSRTKKDQNHIFTSLDTSVRRRNRPPHRMSTSSSTTRKSPHSHDSEPESRESHEHVSSTNTASHGDISNETRESLADLTQSETLAQSSESVEKTDVKHHIERRLSRDPSHDEDQPLGYGAGPIFGPPTDHRQPFDTEGNTSEAAGTNLPSATASAAGPTMDPSEGHRYQGHASLVDGRPLGLKNTSPIATDLQQVRDSSQNTSPHDTQTSQDSERFTSEHHDVIHQSRDRFGSAYLPLLDQSDLSNVSHLSKTSHVKSTERDVAKRHSHVQHNTSQYSGTSWAHVHGRNDQDETDPYAMRAQHMHDEILHTAHDLCTQVVAEQADQLGKLQELQFAKSLQAQKHWMSELTSQLARDRERDRAHDRDNMATMMEKMMQMFDKHSRSKKRKKHHRDSISSANSVTSLNSHQSDWHSVLHSSIHTGTTAVHCEDYKTSSDSESHYARLQYHSHSSTKAALSSNRVPASAEYQSTRTAVRPKTLDLSKSLYTHIDSKQALRDTHTRVPHGTHVGAPNSTHAVAHTSTHAVTHASTHAAAHTTHTSSSRVPVHSHRGVPTSTHESASCSTHVGGAPSTHASHSATYKTQCTTQPTTTSNPTSMTHTLTTNVQSGARNTQGPPPIPAKMQQKSTFSGIASQKPGEKATTNVVPTSTTFAQRNASLQRSGSSHGTTRQLGGSSHHTAMQQPPVTTVALSVLQQADTHTMVTHTNVKQNISTHVADNKSKLNQASLAKGLLVAPKVDSDSFTRAPVMQPDSSAALSVIQQQNEALKRTIQKYELQVENLNFALDVSEKARVEISHVMRDTFANIGLQDSQLHQSTNFDNANNSNSCQQHTVATPRSAAVQQLVDQHNAKTNQKFGNGHATTNPNISHTVFSDNGGVSKAGTKTDQAVAATRCNTPSVSSMSTIDSTDSSTPSATTPSQGGGGAYTSKTTSCAKKSVESGNATHATHGQQTHRQSLCCDTSHDKGLSASRAPPSMHGGNTPLTSHSAQHLVTANPVNQVTDNDTHPHNRDGAVCKMQGDKHYVKPVVSTSVHCQGTDNSLHGLDSKSGHRNVKLINHNLAAPSKVQTTSQNDIAIHANHHVSNCSHATCSPNTKLQDTCNKPSNANTNEIPRGVKALADLPSYDGTTHWESFISILEARMSYYTLPSMVKADILLSRLKGSAEHYVSCLPAVQRSQDYESLKALLASRFADKQTPAMYRVQLQGLSQGAKETIEQFSDRVNKIAMKAFPCDDALCRETAVRTLLTGCKDKEAAAHCIHLQSQYSCVQEAVTGLFMARKNFDQVNVPRTTVQAVMPEQQKPVQQTNQYTTDQKLLYKVKQLQFANQNIDKRMQSHSTLLKELKGSIDRLGGKPQGQGHTENQEQAQGKEKLEGPEKDTSNKPKPKFFKKKQGQKQRFIRAIKTMQAFAQSYDSDEPFLDTSSDELGTSLDGHVSDTDVDHPQTQDSAISQVLLPDSRQNICHVSVNMVTASSSSLKLAMHVNNYPVIATVDTAAEITIIKDTLWYKKNTQRSIW